MKTKKLKHLGGYYHTGEASFDGPEIQKFSHAAASMGTGECQWGPFRTYNEAWADLLAMVESSIRNLQDLHDNVHLLKKARK